MDCSHLILVQVFQGSVCIVRVREQLGRQAEEQAARQEPDGILPVAVGMDEAMAGSSLRFSVGRDFPLDGEATARKVLTVLAPAAV